MDLQGTEDPGVSLHKIIDHRSKFKVKRGQRSYRTFFIHIDHVIALYVAFDE